MVLVFINVGEEQLSKVPWERQVQPEQGLFLTNWILRFSMVASLHHLHDGDHVRFLRPLGRRGESRHR